MPRTSADEQALIAAVVADPADDTPRLVYADWLDEHNRAARAAFIRAQVELHSLTTDSPRRRELAFLARQLLDTHAKAWWWGGFGQPPDPNAFRRGFVESIRLGAADLRGKLRAKAVAGVFAGHPVRRVEVSSLAGSAAVLRDFPAGHAVVALDLSANDLDARDLRRLADTPALRGVRELGLVFNQLTDAAVDVLCGHPFFQTLSVVRLGANPFTPAGRDRLRAHFGDRVTFACERDPDHLYAFQNDYFTVGFGRAHTQLFLAEWGDGFRAAVFDHTGTLLEIMSRNALPRGPSARDRWLAERGYEPATIRVKRFRFPDRVGVYDYPEHFVAELDDPDDPNRDDSRDAIQWWLEDGKFRYDYGGDDCWLNRDGEITDT